MHILILAGGTGTRLWPLSKPQHPKQFLHLWDSHTLLQKTVLRFLSFPLIQTISVVTGKNAAALVQEQLTAIDAEKKVRIFVEPEKKNTAPAIAFGAKSLKAEGLVKSKDLLLVLPSDQLMDPITVFLETLERVMPLAKANHPILFGITPTRPETGYGYIQLGKEYASHIYNVQAFVEKPSRATAESYLASQCYCWNSGIFLSSFENLWQLFQTHASEILSLLEKEQFSELPNISFDYAILEKCKNALVAPLSLRWSDVGSWDSVYEIGNKDEQKNVISGRVHSENTKNCLIIGEKRLISTLGVEDLLIIDTEEALFIGKRGESQKVSPPNLNFLATE
ncbi:MAG: mannose-1-phosphate guanylyltransferase [Verrucomicrobiota bacterium]|nr:mannose-1-phosphate guanylyltransferase [Verrucomicrobiota bacterium]